MTMRKAGMNVLVVSTLCACLAMLGCGAGKGHCSSCNNNSECASGECATFISNSGDKHLLCGNGSSTGSDNCSIPQ